MYKTLFLVIAVYFQVNAFAIEDTLFINRGYLISFSGDSLHALAFNSSEQYEQENQRLIYEIGDEILLTVINNDSISHAFEAPYLNVSIDAIAPGDTGNVIFSVDNLGTYFYRDSEDYPSNTYLGLGGMIAVINPNTSQFYWNLGTHLKSINEALVYEENVDWSTYYPNLFTINSNSNPNINTDTNARIVGNVGDTIHLYISNTGMSAHSMHFHGYHATIIQHNDPNQIGRSKDTFAIFKQTSLLLEIVPHQPGEYPIHDHNLVAVTGEGIYPNGMFTTILIEP